MYRSMDTVAGTAAIYRRAGGRERQLPLFAGIRDFGNDSVRFVAAFIGIDDQHASAARNAVMTGGYANHG